MINSVVLMGRITADPELKYTGNNIPVVSFSLAVDRSFKQQGGERVTDFINIVAWRNTAEFVSKYFTKGQLMAVQGSLQVRNYTDKDGNKRTAYDVVADQVHFAESKRDNQGGGYTPPAPVAAPAAPPSFSNVQTGDFDEVTLDDDLPF